MNVLDLFSGIGGFSLGLERAGMRTVAFCEIDPFCRRVLAKHWPGVPIHHDITRLRGADIGAVDVICGGFPCQDISVAGKGAGLAGARSGLWFEYSRLIGELRPAFVIVENVSGLLSRGIDVILGELAALGYDAEWHCIPASAVGAPHRRDRVWIIAHAQRDGLQERKHVGNASESQAGSQFARHQANGMAASPDATNAEQRERSLGWPARRMGRLYKSIQGNGRWEIASEPVLGRGIDGIPHRVDRVAALGNAVVPQIPEIIGRAIMSAVTSQHQTKGE
jgi:DNA (cytosine-5)-methyltransferase 1